MAAPVAVVSTLTGTRTGSPVTSALICRHSAPLAPPSGVAIRGAGRAPPPTQVPAGYETRILEEPAVGIGVRVTFDEHGGIFAGLGGSGADRLRRPNPVAPLPRRKDARAEGRRH